MTQVERGASRIRAEHIAPEALKGIESFERKHRLKLADSEGHFVGFAELVYFGKPVPAYYLEYVQVNEDHQGKGFGSQAIEQVNQFIKDRGKMGVLINAIDDESAARGMYLAHGWQATYLPDVLVYNAPDGMNDNVVGRMEKAIVAWTNKVLELSTDDEQDENAA